MAKKWLKMTGRNWDMLGFLQPSASRRTVQRGTVKNTSNVPKPVSLARSAVASCPQISSSCAQERLSGSTITKQGAQALLLFPRCHHAPRLTPCSASTLQ